MKSELIRFGFGYDGKKCYVHSRLCPLPGNKVILTTQYLNVAGDDAFDGLLLSKSYDGGRTFTKPEAEPYLAACTQGDKLLSYCDAGHLYHKKTGKALLIGATVAYEKDNPLHPYPNFPFET
ncbi:MAG: hypothetical protein MJ078_04965, partial [Clostridia bacterium]|nr:hypothetical protein [Clostridia bacterium]